MPSAMILIGHKTAFVLRTVEDAGPYILSRYIFVGEGSPLPKRGVEGAAPYIFNF